MTAAPAAAAPAPKVKAADNAVLAPVDGAIKPITEVPDETFAAMAEAGLAALEVDHRDHDAAGREAARTLARALGLGMSGSSDYHGTGKPNRLGENLMAPELLDRVVGEGALPLVTA